MTNRKSFQHPPTVTIDQNLPGRSAPAKILRSFRRQQKKLNVLHTATVVRLQLSTNRRVLMTAVAGRRYPTYFRAVLPATLPVYSVTA